VVQTLPADRADEPLGEGILPRAVRPHALNTLPKRRPVDAVAIAEEIGRCAVIGESVHDLLGCPVGGRVLGHVEVDDAPAMGRSVVRSPPGRTARGVCRHRGVEDQRLPGDRASDGEGARRGGKTRRGQACVTASLTCGAFVLSGCPPPEHSAVSAGSFTAIGADRGTPRVAGRPRTRDTLQEAARPPACSAS